MLMPDHIHAVIIINNNPAEASPCPTLSTAVGTFKSLTTRKIKQKYTIDKVFQNSFYDHIVRDEDDYLKYCKYIEENPLKSDIDY